MPDANDLKLIQVQILKYGIYGLMVVLSLGLMYVLADNNTLRKEMAGKFDAVAGKFEGLPEDFVRLERYKCDQETLNKKLDRLDNTTRDIYNLIHNRLLSYKKEIHYEPRNRLE